MEIEVEYKVVLYNTIEEYEEYEYFDDEDEAIEYAKEMKDDITETSVWLFTYNIKYGYYTDETSECIFDSEDE